MALFRTLKRAFGFDSSTFDDDEPEGIDARVTPLRKRGDEITGSGDDDSTQAPAAPEGVESEAAADSADKAIVPAAIFETVVKIFNESLPEFIRESVDEKSQRDYIYAALDASMHNYMEQLAVDARRRCDARWEGERHKLMAQLDAMRRQSQKNEEDSSDSRKQQLSAERQKRALGERVHELEKQLDAAHAETEQYILENKSLINKIRLQAVLGGESLANADEALVEKIAELTDRNEVMQREAAEAADAKCAAEEKLAQSTADNDALRAENMAHKKEMSSLREALEKSRVKDDMGDAMLTDINARLATAMEAVREKSQEVLDKESEIDHLKHENENMQREYTRLKILQEATAEKLAEAEGNLAVMEQLQRRVTALEDTCHAKEAFLSRQKDEIMQKNEHLSTLEIEKKELADALKKKNEAFMALEDVADNLRKTIENNLYDHAQAESALRLEIERLKEIKNFRGAVADSEPHAAEPAVEYVAADFEVIANNNSNAATQKGKKGKGSRKSKLKISAIDETLEATDWLIATPPPSKRKKEASADDKPDFGYKEPARKSAPDNPAQMSLW